MIHCFTIQFTNNNDNIQIQPFVVCGTNLGRALGDLRGTRKITTSKWIMHEIRSTQRPFHGLRR